MILFCRVRQKDFANLSRDEIKCIIPYLFYHKIDVSKVVPVNTISLGGPPQPEILQLQILENLCAHTSELDFSSILSDARKEISSREESKQKLDKPRVCYLVPSPSTHICLDFESTFGFEKNARYVLAEFLSIQHSVQESRGTVTVVSELFDCSIYFYHVLVILCVLVSEIPSVISLPEVLYSLMFLNVKFAEFYLKTMVCNFPQQWDSVVRYLISKARPKDEETFPNVRIRETLKELIRINNNEYLFVLDYCISQLRLPSFVTQLTLDQIGNKWEGFSVVHLLKRVLLDEGDECRKWFSSYLLDLNQQPNATAPFHAALATLGEDLVSAAGSLMSSDQRLDNGMMFLRVMAALRSFTDYMFDANECAVILRLLTQDVAVSLRGVEFVNLSLAFFVSLYGSLGNATDLDATLVQWLQHLLELQEHFLRVTGTSYGDLLLLLAICFYRHTQLHPSIIEVMQGLLNMRVPSRNRNYMALRKVFTQEVFTEQVLANQAARVPVTKNLNNNTIGQHPVHCVLQLLKSRAFAKNKVAIKDWIYQQLFNCTAPLHHLMPELIEQYVQTVVQPHEMVGLMNKPILERDILALFSLERTGVGALCSPLSPVAGSMPADGGLGAGDEERDLTPQLLILYYILCLKDVCVQQRVEIVKAKRQQQLAYSKNLMSKIPVKYLLHYARKRQGDYRSLYPSLIKLVTKYYPQLVSLEYEIEDLMMLDREWTIGQPESLRQKISNPEDLKKALARVESNPESALLYLQHLRAQPLSAIVPYHGPLVESLPILLHLGRPRRVLTAARDLWLRLNMIMPRKLMVLTVDALRSDEDRECASDIFRSKRRGGFLEEEDILKDPVETFLIRLDARVFRCAPILELVLRMLEFALTAGRSMWDHLLWENPGDGVIPPEKQLAKDEEKNNLKESMLLTLESGVVQLLLERCLMTDAERQNLGAGKTAESQCPVELREVRAIICTFIHHMFIANHELIKLVLWQTYDLEQLPMTLEGIPSLHIGTDFIVSLFCGAADPKRLIFFFNWMSYAALQYRIQKNLDICTTLITAMNQISLTVIPRESKPQFCLACLDGMRRMSKAYPKLAQHATRYLLSLASHCRTELSCLNHPIPPEFRLTDEEVTEKVQSSSQLSLVDKYRVCYVKTMNAFDEIVNKTLVQRHAYHSAE